MTDEQIIKALKICFEDEECTGCPLENNESECEKFNIWEQAFNLIDRQKAEIEMLQIKIEGVQEANAVLREHIRKAVREFAERLQNRCDEQQGCLWSSDIGAVLEEVVGAESG